MASSGKLAPSRHSRRMRLGTKSCSSCRRRKVRCIFDEGSRTCQQCTRHQLVCQSQEVSEDRQKPAANLDEVLRSLQDLLGQDLDKKKLVDAVRGVNRPLSDHKPSPSASSETTETSTFDDAPLFRFLRDSLDFQLQPTTHISPGAHTNPIVISSAQFLLSDRQVLQAILQCTYPFWAIWHPLQHRTGAEHDGFPNSVPEASKFVEESLGSNDPGTSARCLAWLSLCFQQLPKDFEKTTAQLPLRAPDLVFFCVDRVDYLISNLSNPVSTLESIEALILQYKCFLNMGRPHRAWRCTRNALDIAMLLGIHRATGDAALRERALWTTLWRQDRHLSMFLGLPYAVAEHYIGDCDEHLKTPVENRILHQMHLIYGHITDRDQAGQRSYATTTRIAEELDALRAVIPTSWWVAALDPTELIPDLHSHLWHRVIFFFFLHSTLVLHLPYFLRAAHDRKYEYSRAMVLEAALDMIPVYREIRRHGSLPVACDWLDFVAFNAAAILAASLVSQQNQCSFEEEECVWTKILEFSRDLRRTDDVIECVVAVQSAEVLEYLHAARHGTYSGPQVYDVSIPHFGRVQIKAPKSQEQQYLDNMSGASPLQQINYSQSTLELDSTLCGFRHPAEHQVNLEMGEDWTAGMSMEGLYDWNCIFDFNEGSF